MPPHKSDNAHYVILEFLPRPTHAGLPPVVNNYFEDYKKGAVSPAPSR